MFRSFSLRFEKQPTCMCPYMLLKVRKLCEFSFANLTLVWLDPGVYTVVLWQIGRIGKTFLALGASIWLGFLFVDLLAVNQHVWLCRKDLKRNNVNERCEYHFAMTERINLQNSFGTGVSFWFGFLFVDLLAVNQLVWLCRKYLKRYNVTERWEYRFAAIEKINSQNISITGASIWLGFLFVDLLAVNQHVWLCRKDLKRCKNQKKCNTALLWQKIWIHKTFLSLGASIRLGFLFVDLLTVNQYVWLCRKDLKR